MATGMVSFTIFVENIDDTTAAAIKADIESLLSTYNTSKSYEVRLITSEFRTKL